MHTSGLRGRGGPLLLLIPLALLIAGCNIFSWTHDEGGSDDPETLLQDAEDALLDRDWDQALQFARKGIELDPPPMRFPRLRYVAAQAVLGRADISISTYLSVFTNQSSPGKAGGGRLPGLAYELLDLTPEELRAIAESCPQAVGFLREILDALEAGDIGPEDLLGIEFDVDVGFGVAALLTAFVTTLDEDHQLGNGFVRDSLVTIEAFDDGGYTFTYGGPGDSDTFILEELVCPLWVSTGGEASFCDALEGIYDAHRVALGIAAPVDLGCGCAGVGPLPVVPDESFIIGQVLSFVHAGIDRLYRDWASRCDPCPTPRGAP
ncbi:MAG: hypothetical protein ACE5G2_00180 [Candidatus Krumholzibacteriia bacterium]